MSPEPEVTRIVGSWLEEGVDRLPDRVLDSVLEQCPRPHSAGRVAGVEVAFHDQHRPHFRYRRGRRRGCRRRASTLLPGGGVGGPAPAPSAAPTPSRSATPSPSPTPSPMAVGTGDLKQSLEPGTYHVASPFGVPFTISFPATWTPNALVAGDVNMSTAGSSIAIDLVDNVFADPCRSAGGPMDPPVAATVDGIVTALTQMVGFDAGPVSDAVVGGHAGKTFLLTNSIDTATANCARGAMLPIWTFRGDKSGAATNGGTQAQIWVIDVNGTPVAIWGDGDQSTSTRSSSRSSSTSSRSRAAGPERARLRQGRPSGAGACSGPNKSGAWACGDWAVRHSAEAGAPVIRPPGGRSPAPALPGQGLRSPAERGRASQLRHSPVLWAFVTGAVANAHVAGIWQGRSAGPCAAPALRGRLGPRGAHAWYVLGRGSSSVGRAAAFQAACRGFEPVSRSTTLRKTGPVPLSYLSVNSAETAKVGSPVSSRRRGCHRPEAPRRRCR